MDWIQLKAIMAFFVQPSLSSSRMRFVSAKLWQRNACKIKVEPAWNKVNER